MAHYPIIFNGDHAEFEAEHANTPPKERPDWPLPSFDAQDWAEAFCKHNPGVDEGVAQAWFANALMRGYDEAVARQKQDALPEEPTAEMADAGMHCNSEWLNDGAPIGERRYREPAMAVWRTMWRVAMGQDPSYGWKVVPGRVQASPSELQG